MPIGSSDPSGIKIIAHLMGKGVVRRDNQLSKSERHEIESFRDQKRGKASGIMRAVALLFSDEGPYGPAMKNAEIQTLTGLSICNLERP